MNFKELINLLLKHKYKILLTALSIAIATAIYVYLQPDIYRATTTLELKVENGSSVKNSNILSLLPSGAGEVNSETEIEKIESQSNIVAALENVDFLHHYYIEKLYKKHELYNKSPFTVLLGEGENNLFAIHPVDKTHYRVEAKIIDHKTGKEVKIDKLASYGEEVKGDGYDFTLNLKEGAMLDPKKVYYFMVNDKYSAIDMVKKNLTIERLGNESNLIAIHFDDNVPQRAAEFANALAENYLQHEIERKNLEAKKILAFIDMQLAKANKKLQHSESTLENFKKNSNINLGAKNSNLTESLADLEAKISELGMAEELLSSLYAQIRSGKNLATVTAAGLNIEDTGIPQLIREMQKTVLQRKLLLQDYTYEHPAVKRLTQSINQQKRVIATSVMALKKRISRRKKILQQKIKKQSKMMENLPQEEKILGGLKRKFIINEKIYSYLLQKRAETAIQKASTVTNSRIVDRANVPQKPIKPKRKLIVLVSFIIGLLIGSLLVLLREYFDNRIHTEEDINKISNIPVVATIPVIKNDKNGLKVFTSPKSVVTEAYRALRSNLQFMSESENTVITVTSTIAGEGKTTTTVNLASIITLIEKRVIVLNMDMRKPTLHKKFNLPNNEGMSSLLAGKSSIADVIQSTGYNNFDIISSGPIPPNPSELILNKNMDLVIEALKEKYDVIIFDTPPVGLVTDAIALMQKSDITLYVVRAGESKKGFIENANRLRREHKISGLGIVINAIKADSSGYGYGYGYGYYEEDKM